MERYINKKVSLLSKDSFVKAYEYATFLLGIRLRTEGEIRAKLQAKGYESAVIEQVVIELANRHYLNDLRFAETFLDNFKKYKHFGYYGIKKKMIEKHLPSSVVEQVLNDGLAEEEELKIAKRLVQHFQSGPINFQDRQKIARRLAARGFRTETIRKAIF